MKVILLIKTYFCTCKMQYDTLDGLKTSKQNDKLYWTTLDLNEDTEQLKMY